MGKDKSIFLSLSSKVLILLLVALVIGILVVDDISAYIQGLLLGGIFTILKIKLMENTFKRAVEKEPSAAKALTNAHYMLRYVLTFIVLFVGIAVPSINGVAVIIALITMKLAAFWQGALEPKTPLDGSVEFVEWEDDEEESDF